MTRADQRHYLATDGATRCTLGLREMFPLLSCEKAQRQNQHARPCSASWSLQTKCLIHVVSPASIQFQSFTNQPCPHLEKCSTVHIAKNILYNKNGMSKKWKCVNSNGCRKQWCLSPVSTQSCGHPNAWNATQRPFLFLSDSFWGAHFLTLQEQEAQTSCLASAMAPGSPVNIFRYHLHQVLPKASNCLQIICFSLEPFFSESSRFSKAIGC